MKNSKKALIALSACIVLSACSKYAWVNPNALEAGALNRAVGECTTESYKIIPIPQIKPPEQPNFQASGTQYQTEHHFQNSSGNYVTGTSTTTVKNDSGAAQQQYQSAKSAYDSQMRRVQFARNDVFRGCMQSKGWLYTKVTP